jgi:hypothetical protein
MKRHAPAEGLVARPLRGPQVAGVGEDHPQGPNPAQAIPAETDLRGQGSLEESECAGGARRAYDPSVSHDNGVPATPNRTYFDNVALSKR